MHDHAMQLGFVDDAEQALVVTADQQMLAGFALSKALHVCAHRAQHGQTTVLAMGQHSAGDLGVDRLVVRRIGIPINTAQIDV